MDFVEGVVIFDAGFEAVAKADFFADFDPVIFGEAAHLGEGAFAEVFEVIVPDGGDGKVVVIPELALIFGAVGGDGGVARVDGAGFAEFIEEVGEADFDKDVVLSDVILKFVLVLDDGVFEGDAIGADEVGVDDKVVLGLEVADGHVGIPDFFGVGGLGRHTGDDSGNEDADN